MIDHHTHAHSPVQGHGIDGIVSSVLYHGNDECNAADARRMISVQVGVTRMTSHRTMSEIHCLAWQRVMGPFGV